jgi:ATP adenylyltransferase/5',5'''-P-1,P-4-tetraphosphate phosphorylase II
MSNTDAEQELKVRFQLQSLRLVISNAGYIRARYHQTRMKSCSSDSESTTTMKRRSTRKAACYIVRYVLFLHLPIYMLNAGQYQLEEAKPAAEKAVEQEEFTTQDAQVSRSQQEKLKKLRRKAQVVVEHVDIIKDEFWERRPWILSGKPGKLPTDV